MTKVHRQNVRLGEKVRRRPSDKKNPGRNKTISNKGATSGNARGGTRDLLVPEISGRTEDKGNRRWREKIWPHVEENPDN